MLIAISLRNFSTTSHPAGESRFRRSSRPDFRTGIRSSLDHRRKRPRDARGVHHLFHALLNRGELRIHRRADLLIGIAIGGSELRCDRVVRTRSGPLHHRAAPIVVMVGEAAGPY